MCDRFCCVVCQCLFFSHIVHIKDDKEQAVKDKEEAEKRAEKAEKICIAWKNAENGYSLLWIMSAKK